jgi:hypothetical protein
MRPSIGLAAFLALMWIVTTAFMTVSLILFEHDNQYWRGNRYLVTLWAQFVLAIMETVCMLTLVVLCTRARRSIDAAAAAEPERQIQI